LFILLLLIHAQAMQNKSIPSLEIVEYDILLLIT